MNEWTDLDDRGLNRKVGFGLCSGTAHPYGSPSVLHFAGIKTQTTWFRNASGNWWRPGRFSFVANPSESVLSAASAGTFLRVGREDELLMSAWYLQYVRTSPTSLKVISFIPFGISKVNEQDFESQMQRSSFQTSINGHSTYIKTTPFIPVTIFEGEAGYLDSVNLFSNVSDVDSPDLGGMEFGRVQARVIV